MELKIIIKKIIANLFFFSGLVYICRTFFPLKTTIILMYHKVNKENFNEQMKYLKKYYNLISLKELTTLLKEKKNLTRNSIVITFDDGYLNNYLNAYPALKRHGLPATFFIVTSLIGRNTLAWWDKINYTIFNSGKKNYIFIFKNKTIHLDLSNTQKKLQAISILHKILSKYN